MATDRNKAKGRRGSKPFLMLPRDMLESDNFRSLRGSTVKLLVELGSQYRGNNNGDLTAAREILKKRGWPAPATIGNAVKQAEERGFIIRTRQGGLNNKCNLFAITWQPIDECKGKHDVKPAKVASNLWKKH